MKYLLLSLLFIAAACSKPQENPPQPEPPSDTTSHHSGDTTHHPPTDTTSIPKDTVHNSGFKTYVYGASDVTLLTNRDLSITRVNFTDRNGHQATYYSQTGHSIYISFYPKDGAAEPIISRTPSVEQYFVAFDGVLPGLATDITAKDTVLTHFEVLDSGGKKRILFVLANDLRSTNQSLMVQLAGSKGTDSSLFNTAYIKNAVHKNGLGLVQNNY